MLPTNSADSNPVASVSTAAAEDGDSEASGVAPVAAANCDEMPQTGATSSAPTTPAATSKASASGYQAVKTAFSFFGKSELEQACDANHLDVQYYELVAAKDEKGKNVRLLTHKAAIYFKAEAAQAEASLAELENIIKTHHNQENHLELSLSTMSDKQAMRDFIRANLLSDSYSSANFVGIENAENESCFIAKFKAGSIEFSNRASSCELRGYLLQLALQEEYTNLHELIMSFYLRLQDPYLVAAASGVKACMSDWPLATQLMVQNYMGEKTLMGIKLNLLWCAK